MASVTVKNFKETGEEADCVHINGWVAHEPKNCFAALKRILGAYQAMWPDDVNLKNIQLKKSA